MLLIIAAPMLIRIVKQHRVGIDIARGGDEDPRQLAGDADALPGGGIGAVDFADQAAGAVEEADVEPVVVGGRVGFLVLGDVHATPAWCV